MDFVVYYIVDNDYFLQDFVYVYTMIYLVWHFNPVW